MPFKNFKIWRGRLPHWRADDVTYYATFRHRRALDEAERNVLFKALIRSEGRKFELVILCVLSDRTEAIFKVLDSPKGVAFELSKVLESAKRRAGKTIQDNTGERYPPFWEESYDRIIRDDAELEERFDAIVQAPVDEELIEDATDYACLYVQGA